jgi:glutamate/tyrosine decarboxylase-like PLP-dependent enzyme
MDPREVDAALDLIAAEAKRYLAGVGERPLRTQNADEAADSFQGSLPEEGGGALEPLRKLVEDGPDASIASAGGRFFHFVIGGVTPAALAADWFASALDQNSAAWVTSPLGTRLELVTIDWLKDLFRLPQEWGGVLTTGATMANFVCLAAARRWWGERHGVDVDERGLAGLPPPPVFSSGYLHSSSYKSLGMLGIGRETVRILSRDGVGRLDLRALRDALSTLDGAPAILVGNAGEVNAGDFDPIADLADLAEEHGAWLHVDGAFGLFARLSPRTSHLVEGVERAHSATADGHKWLNVPHDCGFAFLRDAAPLPGIFGVTAAYLPGLEEPRPTLAYSAPEGSRRSRSFATWATLRAYGRRGYREMVERHLDLAQRLAARIDQEPDLERLADVPLNIVCFRYRPEGVGEEALDALNASLGEAVLTDGRVYVGTTRYEGRVAFRPAIVNWRTGADDVVLLVEVIKELGAGLTAQSRIKTASSPA